MISLLEHQSLVIRGKCLLTIVLLIKNSPIKWFTILVSYPKTMTLIDRLTKDSYKYVQFGLMHFIDQTNESIHHLLYAIQEDLDRIQANEKQVVDPQMDRVLDQRNDFKNLQGNLRFVTLFLSLVTSSLMRSRLIYEVLLKQIGQILEQVEPHSFKGADEFINALLATLENITGN